MEDKIKIFMTMEDIVELIHDPESVPDAKLKQTILALCFSGEPVEIIWSYIMSHDGED